MYNNMNILLKLNSSQEIKDGFVKDSVPRFSYYHTKLKENFSFAFSINHRFDKWPNDQSQAVNWHAWPKKKMTIQALLHAKNFIIYDQTSAVDEKLFK